MSVHFTPSRSICCVVSALEVRYAHDGRSPVLAWFVPHWHKLADTHGSALAGHARRFFFPSVKPQSLSLFHWIRCVATLEVALTSFFRLVRMSAHILSIDCAARRKLPKKSFAVSLLLNRVLLFFVCFHFIRVGLCTLDCCLSCWALTLRFLVSTATRCLGAS